MQDLSNRERFENAMNEKKNRKYKELVEKLEPSEKEVIQELFNCLPSRDITREDSRESEKKIFVAIAWYLDLSSKEISEIRRLKYEVKQERTLVRGLSR